MKQAYVFPGQGAQFSGMGKDLYENNELAKSMFDKADEILGFPITQVMFSGSDEELKQTKVTQPAVFLHSVILAKVLGVKPDGVAGHSLGEFSALVVAGALSFEDGLRLVAKRAMAMQKCCENNPGGMAAMVEYIQNTTTPCIWVSHHYGYNEDEYTIPENAKIGKACGVSGAPNMAMNRTKITGTAIAFHPGYLVEDGMADLIAKKCEATAEASVVINHIYDTVTRELNVTVSGQVANAEVTEYLLTVLIKENGLVGKQEDGQYYSFMSKGFKEFLHPCVARDVLCSDALGDEVAVENQAYSKNYVYTIPVNWEADNCCIVAYITPTSKKPIINAEETPLVAGTTGGKEYLPFGITQSQAPGSATNLKFDNLSISKPSDGKLALQMIASSATRSKLYGPMKLVVDLEFNTMDTIIPMDTLEYVAGDVLNTFSAGTVDKATQSFGGSHMAYYLSPSLSEEVWQLCHGWRIKTGTFAMDDKGGFYTNGILYNGKKFAITCTLPEVDTAVEEIVFDKAHAEKLMRNGQFIIRIDGVEYDLQGREIK